MQEIESFDVSRAMLEDYHNSTVYAARLEVEKGQPLDDALKAERVLPETQLLTFEYHDALYTFPMAVVLTYNVVQGQTKDQQPWVMTFCNACNTGMVFDPVLDEKHLHFQRRGAYDGLLLIWDEETDSYWQHITGRALHGASQGKQLTVLTTTRQMTAAEAVALHPMPLFFSSELSQEQEKLSRVMEKMRTNPAKVETMIVSTIAQEDTRRPRFELGLGVWNLEGSIFFPLVMLHTRNNALLTEFNGRQLVIYQTPEAISPVAAYVTTERPFWQGDILRLGNGTYIQNDLFYSPDTDPQPLERPMQLLMRWYGFALTFPGCSLPKL